MISLLIILSILLGGNFLLIQLLFKKLSWIELFLGVFLACLNYALSVFIKKISVGKTMDKFFKFYLGGSLLRILLMAGLIITFLFEASIHQASLLLTFVTSYLAFFVFSMFALKDNYSSRES